MVLRGGERQSYTFRVRDILIAVASIPRDTACGEAVRMMLSRPDVPCLVVVDEHQMPLGLVERDRLLSNFAHPIRAELYRRRPLHSFIDRHSLCVDADTHVDEVSATIANRYPRALISGFIITERGRYAGIGTGTGLLSEVVLLTQNRSGELVRTEKLAALGSMVAAIAHEINTPLGNGLMVATTLSAKINEFRDALAGNELRRSTLREFSDNLEKANALLLANLTKAAELIGSFKRVAVDQTSELHRRFDLAEVCSEIITTLRPAYKNSAYRIVVEIAAGIDMSSYPGALGRVITNLVNNAIMHGFDGRDTGTVRVMAERVPGDDPQVVLAVEDDGNGIPEDILPRIFDPFFTTRLGSGGSGLGLHIVNALVMQVLEGQMTVDSRTGVGTRFTLTLPRRVNPKREHRGLEMDGGE